MSAQRHTWGPVSEDAAKAFTFGLVETARQCATCGLIRRTADGRANFQLVVRGRLRKLLAHDDDGDRLYFTQPKCRPERRVYLHNPQRNWYREYPPDA